MCYVKQKVKISEVFTFNRTQASGTVPISWLPHILSFGFYFFFLNKGYCRANFQVMSLGRNSYHFKDEEPSYSLQKTVPEMSKGVHSLHWINFVQSHYFLYYEDLQSNLNLFLIVGFTGNFDKGWFSAILYSS